MIYGENNMQTQSKKIDLKQVEGVKGLVMLFQRIYGPKRYNILFEFKILKMPIYGEVDGEIEQIGEEIVYGAIHFHEFENAILFRNFS